MKAVVQRVTGASVSVEGKVIGSVDFGLLVYLGVAFEDTQKDADWIAEKVAHLRVFDDAEGKMNLSLLEVVNQENDEVNNGDVNLEKRLVNMTDVNRKKMMVNDNSVNQDKNTVNRNNVNRKNSGVNIGVLAISQFTLLGDARKGRRPSWSKAAQPEKAKDLYLYFIDAVREKGLVCECGEFQAHMKVSYTNVGPVTILLDSAEAITK
jgi:D-tyrosyl-tRNA(Tyr) deacylase